MRSAKGQNAKNSERANLVRSALMSGPQSEVCSLRIRDIIDRDQRNSTSRKVEPVRQEGGDLIFSARF